MSEATDWLAQGRGDTEGEMRELIFNLFLFSFVRLPGASSSTREAEPVGDTYTHIRKWISCVSKKHRRSLFWTKF